MAYFPNEQSLQTPSIVLPFPCLVFASLRSHLRRPHRAVEGNATETENNDAEEIPVNLPRDITHRRLLLSTEDVTGADDGRGKDTIARSDPEQRTFLAPPLCLAKEGSEYRR